ncbi:MAG TPA: HAD family hydrolase [Gemmatimonadales bacterium]|nr:HAD family hydrolase [Gemmatimonadales bacterium]
MKLVCFDIDGTLLWTHGAGRRAIRRALIEVLGTPGPIDTFRFDGRTDGEIVINLAAAAGFEPDEALVSHVLQRYVENLRRELELPDHATRVFPGVRQLLEALEARGDVVLGLLTGNVIDGARLKLASAGLALERFPVGAFGSDSHVRSELPAVAQRRARERAATNDGFERERLVIIGDTPADVRCGEGVGARAIGVATGAYGVEELLAAGAYAAFEDLSDTAAVVRAVFQ